jgi:hypothetical protein
LEVGGEYVGQRVDWNVRKDDLLTTTITTGIEEPITVEQHSQLMSWFILTPKEYCEVNNLPEQVGLIDGSFGKTNCSKMAFYP